MVNGTSSFTCDWQSVFVLKFDENQQQQQQQQHHRQQQPQQQHQPPPFNFWTPVQNQSWFQVLYLDYAPLRLGKASFVVPWVVDLCCGGKLYIVCMYVAYYVSEMKKSTHSTTFEHSKGNSVLIALIMIIRSFAPVYRPRAVFGFFAASLWPRLCKLGDVENILVTSSEILLHLGTFADIWWHMTRGKWFRNTSPKHKAAELTSNSSSWVIRFSCHLTP